MKRRYKILELSFKFAFNVIRYWEELEFHKKYLQARQLMKSGTSIGANIREVQNSESFAYFIHKLKIAAKEAYEAEYWLHFVKNQKIIQL